MRSGYRPLGGIRLISMLAMLVVLGMIIARAREPATWKWLVGDAGADTDQDSQAAPNGGAPAAKPGTTPPAQAHPPKAPPLAEHAPGGPTDEDIEEQDGAFEEFMALSDGGLGLGPEEMPAYWRLFKWSENQTLAKMQQRAQAQIEQRESKYVVFNQFIRDPDKQRGQLFTLNLNIRRVLSYKATNNSAGVKQVYEIWGVTTESKAWLYCLVTAHLPEGMPVGPNVNETATVTGYFLKLQGYHEGGAGPRDKPLQAPLLVGRIAWIPSPLQVAKNQPQDWTWIWWVAVVAVVFGILRMGLWIYSRLQPPSLREDESFDRNATRKSSSVRNWLANAEEDSGPLAMTDADEPAPWNAGGVRRRNLTDFLNN